MSLVFQSPVGWAENLSSSTESQLTCKPRKYLRSRSHNVTFAQREHCRKVELRARGDFSIDRGDFKVKSRSDRVHDRELSHGVFLALDERSPYLIEGLRRAGFGSGWLKYAKFLINAAGRVLVLNHSLRQAALVEGDAFGAANFSFQRIFPVACITTNNVMIDPMVIASPVKPFRKNA